MIDKVAFCDSYFWECRLIDELDDERAMSNERGGRVSIQMSFSFSLIDGFFGE